MSPVASVSLWPRDIINSIEQAPEAFTSWDKCMQKDYCKWPVIVGIIIGSLIILSAVACLINCFCCGIQCCMGCGECCACCCPAPRRYQGKAGYMSGPAYHQPAPPSYPYHPTVPPMYRGAQVAQFESPSSDGATPVNEDALPEMPSWNNAVTRRVEEIPPHSDDMEMEPLNPVHNRTASPPSAPHSPSTGYANYRPLDNHSPYGVRSLTATPVSMPSYEVAQPYIDYSYSGQYPLPMPSSGSLRPTQYSYNSVPIMAPPSSEAPGYASYDHQQSAPPYQPSSVIEQPYPSYHGPAHPTTLTSPASPLSFAPTLSDAGEADRPPSLLQSGRRPVPNSYRDV